MTTLPAHLALTAFAVVATVGVAHADATLTDLVKQKTAIDFADSKMADKQKELEAASTALHAIGRKLEAEVPAILAENDRFVDFSSAVGAMVASWNAACAGTRDHATYEVCVKKRALIQPEVTKRDRWSVDLETKAKVHDKAVVDTKKAVVANAAAAAELKAAKAELELIVGDWKLRAAAWRAAQTRHAAGKLCRHIPDSEPERKQSCLSELFDGSNPALRECLDLPFVQLTAFKACLDRKVAGT